MRGHGHLHPLFPLPYPHLSPQSLSATLWIVSSGISAALTTLSGILGDLLAASSINGEQASPHGERLWLPFLVPPLIPRSHSQATDWSKR